VKKRVNGESFDNEIFDDIKVLASLLNSSDDDDDEEIVSVDV
jgi:hypothetical protein